MATKHQTGRITPSRPGRAGGGVRTVYEDFTPASEWKKEQQSQLLLVYLPGFAKEQIKVSVEHNNTLRVRGERLVGGNKWSRFQEDFRIPEECDVSGVRAKFEDGTLTVTIPNKTSPLDQVGPKKQEAKTPSREATSRPGDKVPPKTLSTVTEAKKTEGPSSQKVAAESPKPQKGQGFGKPNIVSAKPAADGKGVGSTSAANITPETTETKERTEGKGRLAEVKSPKHIEPEKAVQKEKDIGEKNKELLKAENSIEKVVKKEKEERGGTPTVRKAKITGLEDEEEESGRTATVWGAKIPGFSDVPKQKQTTDDVTSGGGGGGSDDGFTGKYKQEMKELIAKGGNLNEERQLLLNMGTAILVIVALGAYISYTIGGSSRNEH